MATPKEVNVNGVPFKRSKNGNLIRTKAIQQGSVNKLPPQTDNMLSSLILINRLPKTKEKTELCRRYTSTGTCLSPTILLQPILRPAIKARQGLYLNARQLTFLCLGYCPRGAQCPGIHDPDKIALCPSALRRTNCSAGDACDLSHTLTPKTTPTCTHYLLGRCMKDQCLYSHSAVDSSSAVCRDFAFLGYCQQGQSCKQRHLRECPDYTNDGRCRIRNCALPHVDRASQMRKRLANKTEDAMDVDDDQSSEEGLYDGIDSDDLDSDDLDSPPEQVFGVNTTELTEQDFIGFTS